MYPDDIRRLGHRIVERLLIAGQISLLDFNPERHFNSKREYLLCVEEQVSTLLTLYHRKYLKYLLPQSSNDSSFVFAVRSRLTEISGAKETGSLSSF